ncbi:MAG: 3-phosphoshikimate 1-carboxyvinyltransferase [Butyribacter sp.]|nr:3-phosphoshikimate 1-carboxyvinyltransferase [bacterium]MDY3854825.1 3-phosphoshikimate 1-carboxyvinyltransferase [Butyribacter sp.]
MKKYLVKKVSSPLHIDVEVPGSKSITNRALLMAAMGKGESELRGVLFSDDSDCFLNSLQELGFSIQTDKRRRCVRILGQGGTVPKKEASIYVGSAGTASRFLTAYLAMSDGTYHIDASEQMKKRPMKELLVALEQLGAKITYLEETYSFPMKIEGMGKNKDIAEVELNIDRSSQFLSALLMVSPLRFDRLTIHLTGQRSARSYVEMTEQMMKQFGHPGVQQLGENCYQVCKGEYESKVYQIEPDVSAACYFYAMAAVTGGSAVVRHMKKDSLQGDMRFIDVLCKMGCTISWTEEGLMLDGPSGGKLKGFDVSFSDFSDQALTAAAIAPYADSPVTIRGIAHTRGQESDRIAVICKELERMGISCRELEDGVVITPGEVHSASIQTYNDHRVAMAFAITGLRTQGIEIENPMCCKKTFPEYFEVLEKLIANGK